MDAAGATSIGEIDGPDPLKTAAAYTVQSWLFRRITVERLHLVASFDFAGETAKVSSSPNSARGAERNQFRRSGLVGRLLETLDAEFGSAQA